MFCRFFQRGEALLTRGEGGMFEVFGKERLKGGLLQLGESFREEKSGVMTGTRVEKVEEWVIPTGLKSIGSPHPIFKNIVVTRRSCTHDKGGIWTVTYEYEGVLFEDPDDEFYETVTEIIGGCGEEDIQLHPKFSTLAGKLGAEKNGARFEKDGRFKGFFGDEAGELRGVEKFLDGGLTVSVTTLGKSAGNIIANLPMRATPPGAPSLAGGADWLLVDIQQTRRGTVWETKKNYRASGSEGWNKNIYN